jgi:predicted AAA+ superfamily ATPase
MSFIPRQAEQTLKRLANSFPAVLVIGARQTGKTTLIRKSAVASSADYVTFDDIDEIQSVSADAKTYMTFHRPPVIFDEIQHVPGLFPYLKMEIDENRHTGMFFLTGSQRFSMMKHVTESLAGRIGILRLSGISLRERLTDTCAEPFVPSKRFLSGRMVPERIGSIGALWMMIQKGSYPEIVAGNVLPEDFYGAYLQTYIERDVRQLTQVADELQFSNFVIAVAARTGHLVNYADLARDIGISEVTAKKWLSILVTSGLVYLLQPYSANVEKRVVKTPKLYFMDTGLAAFLTKWRTPEVLMTGAMAGNYFETFVVTEIIKSYLNAGQIPPVYFYRDKDKIEIDLLIESEGTLYPVEIKKTASPAKKDIAAFSILSRIRNVNIGTGAVICPCAKLGILSHDVYAVPVDYI